jgi:hypothetical protein
MHPRLSLVLVLAGLVSGCEGQILEGLGPELLRSPAGGGTGAGGGAPAPEPTQENPIPCPTTFDVTSPLKRLTSTQYANAVRDVFGGKVASSTLFPRSGNGVSATGFTSDADATTVSLQDVTFIAEAADEVALALAAQLPTLTACFANQATSACAGTYLDQYGPRAFRRPLLAAERTAFLALFEQLKAEGAPLAVAAMTSALLQSPQFLYRLEHGAADAPAAAFALTPYELASRLSFLVWDTVPDDALLAAAAQGTLSTDAGLRAEAERLLADPKANAVGVRFWRELIQIPALAVSAQLDQPLITAMQSQFDTFVQGQMRTGTLSSMLTAREVPVDARLKQFYGLPAGGANTTTLPAEQASGVLTLPVVMTGFAHGNDTSIVYRGRFVRTRLLCDKIGAPPNGALEMFPNTPSLSQRDRANTRMNFPACKGCHTRMDPIGLGFEQFDPQGHFRTQMPSGAPVDANGVLAITGSPNEDFVGAAQLGTKLSANEAVAACTAKQWFRFAHGRVEQGDASGVTLLGDSCSIRFAKERLLGANLSLHELVVATALSPSFRTRDPGAP